jgi:putative transposase
MQLVEQHVIKPNSLMWQVIDDAAFASKNLFNAANYVMRQQFFETGSVYSYPALYHAMKLHDDYRGLPAKVSQQVLKGLEKNWKGYFAAHAEWQKDSSKFLGEPRIPHYKDKLDGRNVLTYTIQAISSKLLRIGQVVPSGLSGVTIKTKKQNIDCVRIVPKKTHYVIEIVYTVEAQPADLDYTLAAGIDLGLNNLAVIASNEQGFQPVVVNGRPLKSINQFYNKRKAELQSILGSDKALSHRINRLTDKRNRRINHYLHTASRRVVDSLVESKIGMLVIGKNNGWKQQIGIGKRNNQNFVSIPHARFIEMLKYKCELVGIKVVLTEESHTSKCSFLDMEPVCHQEKYAGKRIKRGLFRSSMGKLINADLNGAYNIIRKVAPGAFSQGVEGVVVHPLPLGIN